MLRAFYFRYVLYSSLPAPLQYAARQAWLMQTEFGNTRNRDRWLSQLSTEWGRWKKRTSDPVLLAADGLLTQGWQMCSDWSRIPYPSGELVRGVKVALGSNPYAVARRLEFAWDTEQDLRSVPIDQVYKLFGLPHESTEEQLRAWETVFWLCFLTEEAMEQAARLEKKAS